MTPTSADGSEQFRLLGVPISDAIVQECVDYLIKLQKSAVDAFTTIPAPDTYAGIRKQEQDTIGQLPAGPRQDARRALVMLSFDAANLSWETGMEHLDALRHNMLKKPPPVWSCLTLARAAVEAFAFSHYHLDPTIGLPQRLARTSGTWVMEYRNQASSAARAENLTQAGYDARVQAATQQGELDPVLPAGARRHTDKGKKGYLVDGAFAPRDPKISSLISSFLPKWLPRDGTYSLLSGAAHARPWLLKQAQPHGHSGWEGEAAMLVTAVIVVAGGMSAALSAWCGYCGGDAEAIGPEIDVTAWAFIMRCAGIAHGTSS
ncbi:hypothetical protein [Nonomuraea soli]|uniref:Uncharacterized protein n=1 Tax=Nonomuraea soli TaxID=1032476 RepID=A0A7W0CUU3_9ACTN|nr:hypothetical protein [Nonomuraea soli]MBA2897751.1 hypothetical protein [Nonomuraea soli]